MGCAARQLNPTALPCLGSSAALAQVCAITSVHRSKHMTGLKAALSILQLMQNDGMSVENGLEMPCPPNRSRLTFDWPALVILAGRVLCRLAKLGC